MKQFVTIGIPTKRYIKAYVIAHFGDRPYMTTRHHIGAKFYDLLRHEKNERRSEFANVRYNDHLKLYVSYHTFRQRGRYLNETQIKMFNLYLEREIKSRFRDYMDFYLSIHPNFKANLPAVRQRLGITVWDWEDDSMKKDYYRYRKRKGADLLYKNSRITSLSESGF